MKTRFKIGDKALWDGCKVTIEGIESVIRYEILQESDDHIYIVDEYELEDNK